MEGCAVGGNLMIETRLIISHLAIAALVAAPVLLLTERSMQGEIEHRIAGLSDRVTEMQGQLNAANQKLQECGAVVTRMTEEAQRQSAGQSDEVADTIKRRVLDIEAWLGEHVLDDN